VGHPAAFATVTGMTVERFARLVASVTPALLAAETARRKRPDRRRAPGAGRRHLLTFEERVFAAVMIRRFGAVAKWPVGLFLGVSRATVVRAERATADLIHAASPDPVRPIARSECRDVLLAACRQLPAHGGRLRSLAFRFGLFPGPDGAVVTESPKPTEVADW
jgi:hypothetical protein